VAGLSIIRRKVLLDGRNGPSGLPEVSNIRRPYFKGGLQRTNLSQRVLKTYKERLYDIKEALKGWLGAGRHGTKN
jgi:hypothetical protein